MTAFRNLAAAEQLRVWEGVHGRTAVGERITLALVELEPDALVPLHSHPQEQVGLLLEGEMHWTIGDERRTVGPGGSWCILGGVPHEVRVGREGAVVVEAFSPVRDDWASLEPSATPSRWPSSAR